MPHIQFVEFGRVALVSYGPLDDKVAVIVDDKRVMIDINGSEEPCQMIPIKRLKLTEIIVKIESPEKKEAVAAAVKEANVAQFEETKWGKNLKAAAANAQMNNPQSFKHSKSSTR